MKKILAPPAIICLLGPTASGKSHLAIQLANCFSAEIISVDSAMVYRGMDIGTAKPDTALLAKIPHHLIDICDPTQTYSAANFCEDAHRWIENILSQQKIPLLTGGTMLYFRALQQGLSCLPSANTNVRHSLTQLMQQRGSSYLHQLLAAVDPVSALRIHPHDPQRLQRALEVYLLTGKTLTQLHTTQLHTHAMPYRVLNIALSPPERTVLHERIAQRFKEMLAAGFLDEVRTLYHRGDLTPDLPALRSVGYRQLWAYLAGEMDEATAIEKAITATRQLAKRQLTWLRSMKDIHWYDSDDPQLLAKVKEKIFHFINISR